MELTAKSNLWTFFKNFKNYFKFVLLFLADPHEAPLLAKVAYNLAVGDLLPSADSAIVDEVHPAQHVWRQHGA